MAERAVVVRLRAEIQGFRSAMSEAAAATRRTRQATEEAGASADTAMGRLVASASKNRESWERAGQASLAFGAAALAGVGYAIKTYADFDKAMSNVQSSTHETSGNMDLLRAAAIRAGADTSFSATEAADAIDELAKAGVSTKDILGGGLTGALGLAAAGGLDVGKAAEIASSTLTQFGLAGDKTTHVADLLAAGAGKAQGSVEDLGMALGQTGLIAGQTGLTVEETTGGLAAFASAGLTGSDAGTSFKTMLQRLTPQSTEAKNKMAELGISAYDAQGNFIGLSKFAGNLQDSMSSLTPEARAAAMGVIFGSDAVRAANVLYSQGTDGIQSWIDKVNDSGYAAVTASIKQDNLAGDLEKLGGSFESTFITAGGAASDALRPLIQGATDLVNTIGAADPRVLQMGVGLTAAAGAAAVLGGGFLTLFPKVMGIVTAFRTMNAEGSRVPGVLGKIGKVAGGAALALVALQAAGVLFTDKQTKSAEDYGNAILKVSTAGSKAKASDLDAVFKGYDKFAGMGPDINSAAEAVQKLTHQSFDDSANKFIDGLTNGVLGFPKSTVGQIEDRLKGLGDELGNITRNGGAESAAKSFNLLTEEFKKNGQSAQDALDKMPGYKDALLEQAKAAGVSLEPNELLDLAMGKVPAKMQAAAAATDQYTIANGKTTPVTEDMQKALDDLGVTIDGQISKLSDYITKLTDAGLLTLSTRDAQRGYADALTAVGLAADGTGGKVGAMGTAFDNNTEQGRKNQAMFDAVAKAGIGVMTSMAGTTDAFGHNVYSQGQLQGQLDKTYNNLITAAGQFGITGGKADALARSVLGIPPGVSVKSWMSDYAKRMAEQTKNSMDAIDGKTVNTYIVHHDDTVYSSSRSDSLSNSELQKGKYGLGLHENGGIVGAFENGGLVQAADGLARNSMIARGGANILWAEPATGWEAYISGKPGQERRNRNILQMIAPRFGLEVRPRSTREFAAVPAPALAGASGDSHVHHHYELQVPEGVAPGPLGQAIFGQAMFHSRSS